MDLVDFCEFVGQVVFVEVLFHDYVGFVTDAEQMVHQLIELEVFGICDQGNQLCEVFIPECL